jgi:hypothetical protein
MQICRLTVIRLCKELNLSVESECIMRFQQPLDHLDLSQLERLKAVLQNRIAKS